MQKLVEYLVEWIKERVKDSGLSGVVFGLSGGIDSAVVGVLCKRAFAEKNLGLIMPCHSSPEDQEHAYLVASKFGINTRTVVLDNIYDELVRLVLPDTVMSNEDRRRLSLINIKPRLRMVVLYYYANEYDYLVVGSSNKSELNVGYFTKYGDGGVDILPLANLVKRQVVQLARYLDIPDLIINKPPSAGLWPGQTDEGEMGLTYNELDNYLMNVNISSEKRAKIEFMMQKSMHKRKLPIMPLEEDIKRVL